MVQIKSLAANLWDPQLSYIAQLSTSQVLPKADEVPTGGARRRSVRSFCWAANDATTAPRAGCSGTANWHVQDQIMLCVYVQRSVFQSRGRFLFGFLFYYYLNVHFELISFWISFFRDRKKKSKRVSPWLLFLISFFTPSLMKHYQFLTTQNQNMIRKKKSKKKLAQNGHWDSNTKEIQKEIDLSTEKRTSAHK